MPIKLVENAPISRHLTPVEYFFASFGASRPHMDPIYVVRILEGTGSPLDAASWRRAADLVAKANPSLVMRLRGDAWSSRWETDGAPISVRTVDHTDWDGMSSSGTAFLRGSALSLTSGPIAEIVLVNHTPRGRMIVFGAYHAAVDGGGMTHFINEMFRAHRDEPLQGSNASFGLGELMSELSHGLGKGASRGGMGPRAMTRFVTGPPMMGRRQAAWRRMTLETTGKNILARVVVAMAEYFHLSSDLPAIFDIPVDLRRRVPGLLSTRNFSSNISVRIHKGDRGDVFRRQLNDALAGNAEVRPFGLAHAIRLIPRKLYDRLIKTFGARQFLRGLGLYTAVVSNLGRFEHRDLSYDGFLAQRIYAAPSFPSMVILTGLGSNIDICLGFIDDPEFHGIADECLRYVKEKLLEKDVDT